MKTLKILNKLSKKYKIQYYYEQGKKDLYKYYGFNDFFAEFIDVELLITSSSIEFYLSPELTFDNIQKIPRLNGIKVDKLENNRIIYYIDKECIKDLKKTIAEIYKDLFSIEVKKHYFNLILTDYREGNNFSR